MLNILETILKWIQEILTQCILDNILNRSKPHK